MAAEIVRVRARVKVRARVMAMGRPSLLPLGCKDGGSAQLGAPPDPGGRTIPIGPIRYLLLQVTGPGRVGVRIRAL